MEYVEVNTDILLYFLNNDKRSKSGDGRGFLSSSDTMMHWVESDTGNMLCYIKRSDSGDHCYIPKEDFYKTISDFVVTKQKKHVS